MINNNKRCSPMNTEHSKQPQQKKKKKKTLNNKRQIEQQSQLSYTVK